MLLAQPAPPLDCRRVRSEPELQPCEVQRTEHDVLNYAHRPPARELGNDAVRFSMQPSLGGRAFVVEAVRNRSGSAADVRIFELNGHLYYGWDEEDRTVSHLSADAYRRLAAIVDHYLAVAETPPPPPKEDEEGLVCMDGPENLTERVREGRVVTLSGFCPPNEHELHPNEHIAASMLSLACPSALEGGPDGS